MREARIGGDPYETDLYVVSPAGQVDTIERTLGEGGIRDAEYIASWHPLVALAVAGLLEREAALIEAQVFPQSDPVMERYPLAVARAYLGEATG